MNRTTDKLYFPDEKRYEDLTITDNFMFAKVMQNERLCKKFLELIKEILPLEGHTVRCIRE